MLFNCPCHERDKVHISAKVRRRTFDSGPNDDLVRENVRKNYKELRDCFAALQRMMDGLSCELSRPVAPCEELRRALEDCYTTHVHQPLKCNHLVTALMKCARDCALTARS